MFDNPRLSKKELKEIKEDLKEDFLDKASPSEKPVAIILGGQPGAGKSTMLKTVAKKFMGKGGSVEIDFDALRYYHPRYAEYFGQMENVNPMSPERSAGEFALRSVSEYAMQWRDQLIDDAIKQKKNIIHDQPSTDKDMALARKLKAAGYRVEVHFLAVNEKMSLLGTRKRYEDVMKQRLKHDGVEKNAFIPRQVSKYVHDMMYKDSTKILSKLENMSEVDSVSVWNRNSNEPLYENQKTGGEKSGAKQAVEEERQRPWTEQEYKNFVVDSDRIIALMKARDAKGYELEPAIKDKGDIVKKQSRDLASSLIAAKVGKKQR